MRANVVSHRRRSLWLFVPTPEAPRKGVGMTRRREPRESRIVVVERRRILPELGFVSPP
jgi:hypothetical protein